MSIAILERKAAIGHKDVDSFIKSKIVKDEPITVSIIIGKSAIIDEDIKPQLKEAIGFYRFYFTKINLTSGKEIIENLNYYQRKCDLLAIARGGGENLEIFEAPEIAEASCHFQHLLSLPSDTKKMYRYYRRYGQGFHNSDSIRAIPNEIYNNTVAEL